MRDCGWVAHFLHRLLNGVKGVQKKSEMKDSESWRMRSDEVRDGFTAESHHQRLNLEA